MDLNPFPLPWQYYHKSVEMSCPRGMVSAALRYLDGVGTEVDEDLALNYMQDAASCDNLAARAFIAGLRKSGLSRLVPHDENQAFLEFAGLIDHRVPAAYLEVLVRCCFRRFPSPVSTRGRGLRG